MNTVASPTPSTEKTEAPRECDLVLKGGITSGVIYPLAICELAKTFQLRSIGGASAGAIAAAAAAAAEYRRQRALAERKPADVAFEGFKELELLPELLAEEVETKAEGKRSRLLTLFQPTGKTGPAFRGLLLALERRAWYWKVVPAIVLSFRAVQWPLLLTLACVVGLAASVFWFGGGGLAIALASICSVFGLVVGSALSLLLAVKRLYREVGKNGAGICRGYSAKAPTAEPPLTTWLADLIDRVAGRDQEGPPLTFAELQKYSVDARMMTTALTFGRPHRLPFESSSAFFFRVSDFSTYFPKRVVEAMRKSGAVALTELSNSKSARDQKVVSILAEMNKALEQPDYLPFPAEELPLVVAARMSLSFPLLLSAVPLYGIDWTRTRNPDAEHAPTTRPEVKGVALPQPEAQRGLDPVWFSDGGICSNLPLHFFDSLVPARPTFAMNLREPHPLHEIPDLSGKPTVQDEAKHVWIPESNNAGFAERWKKLGDTSGIPPVDLLLTMIDTMQAWNDNTLAKVPGYRDRIIHISHTEKEGGLNLDMPADVIQRLTVRGQAAGMKLVSLFGPGANGQVSKAWSNHVWVRYRSALAMLEQLLADAATNRFNNPPLFNELYRMCSSPPSYDWNRKAQQERAEFVTDLIRGWGQVMTASDPGSLREGAPKPTPELKPRPTSV